MNICTQSQAVQIQFLNRVNASVNNLPYQHVQQDDNADVWTDQDTPGRSYECRDYALTKADQMRAQGWPLDRMFLVEGLIEPAPGLTPDQRFHCVLGARDSTGIIWILDNRVMYPPHVYDSRTPVYPYTWLRQQIPGTLTWSDAINGALV